MTFLALGIGVTFICLLWLIEKLNRRIDLLNSYLTEHIILLSHLYPSLSLMAQDEVLDLLQAHSPRVKFAPHLAQQREV